MQRGARPFFHGYVCVFRSGAHELRLRSVDVNYRVEPDGLRDDTAPSRLESAGDVGLRLSRGCRRQEKRILKMNPGKRYGTIHTHTASELLSHRAFRGSGQQIAHCSRGSAMNSLRRQDIQLVPASLFHFVVIFFACDQNSIEPRPVMSPTPNFESFQPPNENGSRGTGTPTLTPTTTALACSLTYRAVPPLSVKTEAAFP